MESANKSQCKVSKSGKLYANVGNTICVIDSIEPNKYSETGYVFVYTILKGDL